VFRALNRDQTERQVIRPVDRLSLSLSHKGFQATLAAVVALTVVTLLLLPLKRVDYTLEADLRMLRFRTAGKQTIALPMPVQWVVIQGHRQVYIPSAAAGKTVSLTSPVVHIAADKGGSIKLEFPPTPSGAKVQIASIPEDGILEVLLCGFDEPARIAIAGHVKVSGESTHFVRSSRPALLLVVPHQSESEGRSIRGLTMCGSEPALRYRFLPERISGTEAEVISGLRIRDLELFSETLGQQDVLRPSSSILGGQLRIGSIGGKVRPLLRNEFLLLENNSGELRSVLLRAGALNLMFEGSAHGLYVGSQNNRSSIMPTFFQWVQSRDQIVLAWSTGVSALGLLFGLFAWFKSAK
jgi:hypothetical protein